MIKTLVTCNPTAHLLCVKFILPPWFPLVYISLVSLFLFFIVRISASGDCTWIIVRYFKLFKSILFLQGGQSFLSILINMFGLLSLCTFCLLFLNLLYPFLSFVTKIQVVGFNLLLKYTLSSFLSNVTFNFFLDGFLLYFSNYWYLDYFDSLIQRTTCAFNALDFPNFPFFTIF